MIESKFNEKVKAYTKLNNKKDRDLTNLFVASGTHLVEEALKHHLVKDIFLLNGEKNIYDHEVIYTNSEVLKKISNLTNAPKVLAVCNKLPKGNITGNVIILDDIADPGNMGTIIRSAVAFNYDTIIVSPTSVDIYNEKVIRGTEGMLFNLKIIIAPLEEEIKKLKDLGYLIYGTDVNGGASISKEEKKHALIIGSEARGMHQEYRGLCDKLLYIKMNSKCESLNAGVSASILMYELGNQNER